ncbi:TM2 domain-containing protein [Pseudovibrio sp. SPO723]|uniref:TM2 domain-containing protein n=1 Tax=Nesiotobacter zosterae TaxID=392721 RepID=UPI0029C1845F|nr:TM2 domain-containing protein [Pseudovibrio sp. SPO723]MDX5593310.1 TM2 domain-containing protein [Pseudovibrio sp. SPO723]
MTTETEALAAAPAAGAHMIYCNTCGQSMAQTAPNCPKCGAPNALAGPETSNKSFVAALLLCLFFGIFGIHRFYVGKIGTGILQLITLGGLGIWSFIDLIMIIVGSFKDKQGRPLKR